MLPYPALPRTILSQQRLRGCVGLHEGWAVCIVGTGKKRSSTNLGASGSIILQAHSRTSHWLGNFTETLKTLDTLTRAKDRVSFYLAPGRMGLNRHSRPKLSPDGQRRALSPLPILPTLTVKVKTSLLGDIKEGLWDSRRQEEPTNLFLEPLLSSSCTGQTPGITGESEDRAPAITLNDLCPVEV